MDFAVWEEAVEEVAPLTIEGTDKFFFLRVVVDVHLHAAEPEPLRFGVCPICQQTSYNFSASVADYVLPCDACPKPPTPKRVPHAARPHAARFKFDFLPSCFFSDGS